MPLTDTMLDTAPQTSVALVPVRADDSADNLPKWAQMQGFSGRAGEFCLMPGTDGGLERVLVGLGDGSDRWAPGDLPRSLPAGAYHLETTDAGLAADVALAWLVGGYSFDRYRTETAPSARLLWPQGIDKSHISSVADAVALVRDLVNTPACDMGPADLQAAAEALATRFGASATTIVGDALLDRNYPMIHAVGRAATAVRAPRLIDLTWGDPAHPKVTLVGKGVCFDSGGLDIKPASSMKLMKKDMGGAAHVLGLASMIMAHGLPVRLRVLVPAVENAVSADAFRPGDVLRSRKGLTVEVNNTDAEGRLVLADALAEADAESPELLLDFATLTGAARVALGPELPPFFTHDDRLAGRFAQAAQDLGDPLWRLPLWPGYRAMVEGRVGDLDNAPEGGMAGAITAALFLDRFVTNTAAWVHFDVYAWCPKARPARPVGGAAQGLRAAFRVIAEKFPMPR